MSNVCIWKFNVFPLLWYAFQKVTQITLNKRYVNDIKIERNHKYTIKNI